MSGKQVPTVKTASGANIPVVGLGTWKSQPGEVLQAVKDAIDVGYRHFDCALIYGNENEVGQAFAEKIKEGVIKREDLFVTSKLWNTYHSKDRVKQGITETLTALKLDYLDLYLIHWPMAWVEDQGVWPLHSDGETNIDKDVDFVETWQGMEELQKSGKAKFIGVSNFNIEQLKRIQAVATVPITCNQIEVHVYLQNRELIEYCQKSKIQVVAYSPLGSIDRPKNQKTRDYPPPIEDEAVKSIAQKHKKQPGQILLKFLVQQQLIVIPKSVRKERMQANLELFDFELDGDDIHKLQALDKKGQARACTMDSTMNNKYYPFDRIAQ